MHIDYTITPQDIAQFNVYINRHTPTLRRKRRKDLVISTLVGVTLGVIAYLVRNNVSLAVVLSVVSYVVLIIGFTSYFAVTQVQRRMTHKLVRDGIYNGLLGQHSVSLRPDVLAGTSMTGKGELLWTAVDRIDVTDAAIYIFIAEVRGLIVPRHGFQDDAQYHTFVQLMKQYHAVARQQVTRTGDA